MKILLFLSITIMSIFAQDVKILAAGNLKTVLPELIRYYEKVNTNDNIKVSYGASGNLVKKIINKESFDIFLSADMQYPASIYKSNLAANMPKVYTKGALILYTLGRDNLTSMGIKILDDKSINTIEIPNKTTAPYGKAAIEALKNSNIYQNVKDKIKFTPNASLVLNEILWNGGYAGILPKSFLQAIPNGYAIEGQTYVNIDSSLFKPLKQGFVFSKTGIKNISAKKFIDFLLSQKGKNIFKQYGYK